jgi:hypothetical protein
MIDFENIEDELQEESHRSLNTDEANKAGITDKST